MKFELAIALKYLIPKRRHLAASMIGFVSTLVISLVVWLVLVFLSVTEGMEKNWIDKIVALNAPLRVEPTDEYFSSYYYRIDAMSASSEYRSKTLYEKVNTSIVDPYNVDEDLELPIDFPPPDLNKDGTPLNIALEAKNAILSIQDKTLKVSDYEVALGQLRLRMLRPLQGTENFVTQASYLTAIDSRVAPIDRLEIKPNFKDLQNTLLMLPFAESISRQDSSSDEQLLNAVKRKQRFVEFFNAVSIKKLKTPPFWKIPIQLLPSSSEVFAYVQNPNTPFGRLLLSKDKNIKGMQPTTLRIQNHIISYMQNGQWIIAPINMSIYAMEPLILEANLIENSLDDALDAQDIIFNVSTEDYSLKLSGKVPLDQLIIFDATGSTETLFLPKESIVLPKSFRDSGALIGDRGYIAYYTASSGNLQEQRLPVSVSGFYDAGLMPGKFALVDKSITSLINSSLNAQKTTSSSGFQVWFKDPSKASLYKSELEKIFESKGISPYFRIQTYEEYDFAKDLILQLKSDRHLFTLIAIIIILVACSNIISMLLLLVNDKKKEIGILRSLGASSASIAQIFGLVGIMMGILSSLIGLAVAYFTLMHLQTLVEWISALQGYDVFNSVFYGSSLPNTMSQGAVALVLSSTTFLSLIAGLIPAIRASRIKPVSILRSEA
ncbi:MAG: ABC transporter permease [Parachlamydiales bacterium]|nr:ABC transporter permease [Parachlamydiales bacterium]